MLIKLFDVGDLEDKCKHCGAYYFKGEHVRRIKGEYRQCCNMGKKIIRCPFEKFPNKLRNLFIRNQHGITMVDGMVDWQRNFRENIRQYNSMFAVGSFKAKIDYSILGRGPYAFKIQGDNYHTSNLALYPDEEQRPEYAQLFFIDTAEATDYRMNIESNQDCDEELVYALDELMRKVNPYFESFKMMHEVYSDEFYRAQVFEFL